MTRGGRDELLSDVVRLWRVRAGRRSWSCLSVSRGDGWLVGELSEGEGEGGGWGVGKRLVTPSAQETRIQNLLLISQSLTIHPCSALASIRSGSSRLGKAGVLGGQREPLRRILSMAG